MNDAREFDLFKYWRLVTKRPLIVITTTLAMLTFVVFGNKALLPDEYVATALIRVSLPSLDQESRTPRDPLSVLKEELLSRTTLEDVINELNLQEQSAAVDTNIFVDILTAFGKKVEPRQLSKEILVRKLRKQIKIETNTDDTLSPYVNHTEVFSVSMASKYPELASDIVNVIVNTFIESKKGSKINESREMVTFLSTQVKDLQSKITNKTRMIDYFKKQNAMLLAPENSVADAYFEAKRGLFQAISALQEAKTQVHATSIAMATESPYAPTLTPTGDLDSLHPGDRLAFLENELAAAQSRYSEEHPDIQRLRRNIKSVRRQITVTGKDISRPYTEVYRDLLRENTEAKHRVKEAQTRVEQFQSEVTRLGIQLKKTPEIREMLNTMENAKQTLTTEYETVNQRLVEARIIAQAAELSVVNNFKVIDPAIPPTVPKLASRTPIHFVGIIFSLGCGLMLAFLIEMFYPKQKSLPYKKVLIPAISLGYIGWIGILGYHILVEMLAQYWSIT